MTDRPPPLQTSPPWALLSLASVQAHNRSMRPRMRIQKWKTAGELMRTGYILRSVTTAVNLALRLSHPRETVCNLHAWGLFMLLCVYHPKIACVYMFLLKEIKNRHWWNNWKTVHLEDDVITELSQLLFYLHVIADWLIWWWDQLSVWLIASVIG